MGEEEIMDQLQELDAKLKSFPPDAHLFCPRRNDEDPLDYEQLNETEEDISPEEKRELIREGRVRHSVAYKYSLVFGMDTETYGDLINPYHLRWNQLLAGCDKCVYNWHLGRKPYLKELSEQFDEEIVSSMASRLNEVDFARIDAGLQSGQETLNSVESQKRTQGYLSSHNQPALFALFESLCCVDYHRDDETLSKYFDFVFEEIQTRKVLRMMDALPAMARFLFSRNHIRHRFATAAWQKMESKLTAKTFDWVVHDVLAEAIVFVAQPSADPSDIQIFWQGFLLILDKMDKDLITHRLRGMEVQPDIYRLALQHLAANSGTIVQLVIDALRILLEKASEVFWSAMGTISPMTVVDQICQSQGFGRLLANPQNFEDVQASPVVSWVSGFVNSIASDHQYEACRTLLRHLLGHVQGNERYSEQAKISCVIAGLKALHLTLETFIKPEYKVNPSTSLIVISQAMELVKSNMPLIAGCADVADNGDDQLRRLGMLVIKDALTLDCKSINAECKALQNDIPIQRGLRGHSQSIWQAVLNIFRAGKIELAKAIIPATLMLVGLDKFTPKDKKKPLEMPTDHMQFNKDLGQLMDNVSRIFDRLSDFPSSDLGEFSQEPSMSRPLFASLISSDESVCQATVELIKKMTGEETRQDAIQNLLETSFIQMLGALNFAANQVTKTKAFGAVPNMIRFNREALMALTGNTGVIRARSGFSKNDKIAIMGWWTSQWRGLEMIFTSLEDWSTRINKNTEQMLDFTRDIVEYAEALFDQHNVFASSLKNSTPISTDDEGDSEKQLSSTDAIRKVLQVISNNLYGMAVWLRLRDEYMIGVVASLLGKLLRVLGDYDLEVDEKAADFIKSVVAASTRTKLSKQQIGELQRALDDHHGLQIIEAPKASLIFKKQATIDSWSNSADGKQHEPRLPPRSDAKKSGVTSKHTLLSKPKANSGMSDADREAFMEKRRKLQEENAKNRADAAAKARALREPASIRGQGSGLSTIGGIAGKDHAPTRNEIMVGSSDDESDEDGDEDETNALVTRRKDTNKAVAEYEESRRRARALVNAGPVKKTKIQRSAKDLRARVEPNMDRLYLEILNWDIFHNGDNPPSNNDCRRIDNKYLDLDLYKSTFAPLLISEVWRSLVTARDENNHKPIEIKVLNRLSVDKFMEVSTNMPMSNNRDLLVSERDIVLLSQSPNPLENQSEPHCLARVNRTTRKKDVLEVTYLISRDTKPALLQFVVPNGKLHVVKIADMTTTQREYAALSSLEYYDLCTEVLEAKPSPLQKYSDEKISTVSSKYNLNKGQAQAILSANDNDGFTLIQGPPGSGKTKTIVAMVGSLLTQTLQQQAQQQAQQKPTAPGQPVASTAPKKKLLICAPSNAAVDELVVRLKEGILPLNGPRQNINVIRIGRSDAINAAVKDVMLDELVQRKLEGNSKDREKVQNDREKLHKDAAQIKERLNVVRPLMDEAQKENDSIKERSLRQEFDQLKRSQAMIGSKIDEDKQSGNSYARQNEINRRRFQQEIINGAHVLCSTLSGSGHDMFRNLDVEFETVIIDEAAQCIELSALIPLKYGCSKCILVGDPEQLPPTVLSRSAQSFGYEQSLFVRMQKNHPRDVHLLDTQYRMHPEISSFPSEQFYNSKLIDGPGMAKLREQPWHASTILGPYRFFDVEGTQTQQLQGHSFINVPELNAALQLYARLKADYQNVDFKGKIGIITSYKAQLNEMKARFSRRYGDGIFDEIEFNTTDAFQGREREIIIFSCVRAKATGGIGFLGDIRRMNVGLTRAKSSLWVLGDSRSLQQGQFWNKLIEDAKIRGRYTTGDVMALLSKPTSRGGQPPVKARPTQVNGNAGLSALPTGPTVSSNASTAPAGHNDEDDDTQMVDAPSISSSRASSISGGAGKNLAPKTAGPPNALVMKHKGPTVNNTAVAAAVAKRPRDIGGGEQESGPSKRARPGLPLGQMSSIEEALQAQQAAKAKARPRPPGGVPPPRRPRPAADPFIQRKPPKRN